MGLRRPPKPTQINSVRLGCYRTTAFTTLRLTYENGLVLFVNVESLLLSVINVPNTFVKKNQFLLGVHCDVRINDYLTGISQFEKYYGYEH